MEKVKKNATKQNQNQNKKPQRYDLVVSETTIRSVTATSTRRIGVATAGEVQPRRDQGLTHAETDRFTADRWADGSMAVSTDSKYRNPLHS